MRHELALGVDDTQPFEPRSRDRESDCSQLREAPAPFDAVFLAIEIEIIKTRFGNRCCARGCGHQISMPDMDAAGKAERPIATTQPGLRSCVVEVALGNASAASLFCGVVGA